MAHGVRSISWTRLATLALGVIALALGVVVLVVGAWRDPDGGDSWSFASPRARGPRVYWYGDVAIDPRSIMPGRRMPGWRGLRAGILAITPGEQLIVVGGWPHSSAAPFAASFANERFSLGLRLSPAAAFVAGAHGWWLVGIGAGAIALVGAAPAGLRAWRRRRGLCAGCGYPGEGAVCPECGGTHSQKQGSREGSASLD